MKFEWDAKKASINYQKHKIAFEEAITVFDDPFALIAIDEKHSTKNELREWIIGEADFGIIVAIFTIREPGNIYRIISARKANRKEKTKYETFKRIPF